MAFIYFVMYLLQALSHLLYWVLLFGVPALIVWQAVRNRARPLRLVLWLLAGLVWATPAVVESWRDRALQQWMAGLPAAPVVQIPAGSLLALQDGFFDPEFGQLIFANCHGVEHRHPFCNAAFGPEVLATGLTLGLFSGTDLHRLTWAYSPDCPLEQRYLSAAEPFTVYLNGLGICPTQVPSPPQGTGFRLVHTLAQIPAFPGEEFGQLRLYPLGSDTPLTTLTSFTLERPDFPALWGAHWLPVLSGLLPDVTTEIRYGQTFDEEVMTGFPAGSLQNLVFSQGWGAQPASIAEIWAGLDALFPYNADRALPALRSNSFFPTRYALELVCAPGFAKQVTPQVLAEVRRIATQPHSFSNNYPRQRAQEALETGCANID